METVEELIERLKQLDPKAPVRRLMTADYGTTEIQEVRVLPSGTVVID